MHLTLADKLRMMEPEVDEDCPIQINNAINKMLQAAAWGLRATISTVAKISPGGSVFGRDMVFNFQLRVDWENVARKKKQIGSNRKRKRKCKKKMQKEKNTHKL